MTDLIQAFLVLAGAMFAAACIAGAVTFAIVAVCRHMKWSPINVTVNLRNDFSGDQGEIVP